MAREIQELKKDVMAPITRSSRVNITGSVIIIRNAGNADATLDTHYTLEAGASLVLGTSNDRNTIITGQFNFTFGAGSNPRIEVLTLTPNAPEFANYSQQ